MYKVCLDLMPHLRLCSLGLKTTSLKNGPIADDIKKMLMPFTAEGCLRAFSAFREVQNLSILNVMDAGILFISFNNYCL